MFKVKDNQYFLDTNDILKIFDMAIVKDSDEREFGESFDFNGMSIYESVLVFHKNIFMIPKSDIEELQALIRISPTSSYIDGNTVHCANFFISEKPTSSFDSYTSFCGLEFSKFLEKYIFFRHLNHRGIIVKLEDYNSSYFKMKYL